MVPLPSFPTPAVLPPAISAGNGFLYAAVGAPSAEQHVLLRLFFHCPLSGSLVIGHSPEKKRKKKPQKTETNQTRQARPPTVLKFLQIAAQTSPTPVSVVLCSCSGGCGNRLPVTSGHRSYQSAGFSHCVWGGGDISEFTVHEHLVIG